MRYVSTRGLTPSVDFEGALFSGYAPDGGLFVPAEIPRLDEDTLRRWSVLPYPGLVKELCSLFITPELIPREDLNRLIDRAFSRFRHRDVVHLSRMKDGLNVLELWHGVTYAFKDLALSCTGQFLQYFLEKRQKHVTIVVGTSGDTGSSAIESVRGEKNMDILVLLPKGYCSQIQELQMTTVLEDNVHVFVAGCLAQRMGLPLRLVAVANDNDIIHRTIERGDFSLSDSVKPTLASAMDIQVPYNMERIFWLLSDSDSTLINALMEKFDKTKRVKLPEILHREISEMISSRSVSDEEIVHTMQRCWEENRYLLCPHSAVAVFYHYKQSEARQPSIPRCCLAPASAVKFQDAVLRAELLPEIPPEIKALETMETRATILQRGDNWTQILRDAIEALARRRERTSRPVAEGSHRE
ncbi:threonine synthase-like 2 isoform X4 [Ornithorhynchus anatinus]|uniref:Threonine synthase-like 2 n=1 Tax=Ornithorhynchus anatinus TaxID=9258 RepID=A0A6I8NI06_ORNAN|nr:threonine synthase-like 2 isoform X4 [Ornithorhynchus anatinus]